MIGKTGKLITVEIFESETSFDILESLYHMSSTITYTFVPSSRRFKSSSCFPVLNLVLRHRLHFFVNLGILKPLTADQLYRLQQDIIRDEGELQKACIYLLTTTKFNEHQTTSGLYLLKNLVS